MHVLVLNVGSWYLTFSRGRSKSCRCNSPHAPGFNPSVARKAFTAFDRCKLRRSISQMFAAGVDHAIQNAEGKKWTETAEWK